jgi:hypothetical protein
MIVRRAVEAFGTEREVESASSSVDLKRAHFGELWRSC